VAYAVFLKPAALRDLRKLSEDLRRRVASRIDALAGDPRPAGIERLLFFWPGGVAWTKWTGETQFKGVLTGAKIERPLVFPDLQRTFATLEAAGVHGIKIQESLGHKN